MKPEPDRMERKVFHSITQTLPQKTYLCNAGVNQWNYLGRSISCIRKRDALVLTGSVRKLQQGKSAIYRLVLEDLRHLKSFQGIDKSLDNTYKFNKNERKENGPLS